MKRKRKKLKIRFDRIFFSLLFLLAIGFIITRVLQLKITNIYIDNNVYLNDQEIIEKAGLQDYPATFKNLAISIEKRLENDTYIKSATVKKRWFTRVYITIEENRPLFYYQSMSKTILLDGTSVDTIYSVPTVLNYITDNYFDEFVVQMGKLDQDVLYRISEIQFVPNEVDLNRFLLSMNDGNYVYVNLTTFEKMNKYISILENLPQEKGVLYLDYGNNFEIFK